MECAWGLDCAAIGIMRHHDDLQAAVVGAFAFIHSPGAAAQHHFAHSAAHDSARPVYRWAGSKRGARTGIVESPLQRVIETLGPVKILAQMVDFLLASAQFGFEQVLVSVFAT